MKKRIVALIVLIICFGLITFGLFMYLKNKKPSYTTETSVVRIYSGEEVYLSTTIKTGDYYFIPDEIVELKDSQGNAFKGVIVEDFGYYEGRTLKVTKDTNIYVVFEKSVQVIFNVTKGESTINTTTTNIVTSKCIGDNIAPVLAEGQVWVIQWTESGFNIGETFTNEEIANFVVYEPIIFVCKT